MGVPSVTHAFGGAVPAGLLAEAGDRLAAMWRRARACAAAVRRCFEAVYLDICPTSVQAVPTDHIADVQSLRPVGGRRCERRRGAAARLRDDGHGPEPGPDLGPLIAAVAALPVSVLVAVGQDGDAIWAASLATSGSSVGWTSRGCSSSAPSSSPMEVGDVPRRSGRRASRSSACRRRRTSSATRKEAGEPGAVLALVPGRCRRSPSPQRSSAARGPDGPSRRRAGRGRDRRDAVARRRGGRSWSARYS